MLVTSADSQFIMKSQNDLSKPGAQPWVKLFYARRENSYATDNDRSCQQ